MYIRVYIKMYEKKETVMEGSNKEKIGTVYLGARINPDAKERLFKIAAMERRSVAKQIEHMIVNYQIQKQ